MTRRLKRNPAFDLSLEIKQENFIRPPRESQRNWLLNRAVAEFSDDLVALNRTAARFVPGSSPPPMMDRTQTELCDQDIMEDWQIPLMQTLADMAAASSGSVLEIGFGRGIASTFVQQAGVREHTIIECNDSVVERYHAWRSTYPGQNILLAHGLWQEKLPELGKFDSILFHTYPLNETEVIEQIGESVTFAEHFFPHAAQHLEDGGTFAYLSFEIDSLSRSHQRALFKHFSSINLRPFPVQLPDDVRDAWWADLMVVVGATL